MSDAVLASGTLVTIHGLSSEAGAPLNGRTGVVTDFDVVKGRHVVEVDGHDAPVRVLPQNLTPTTGPQANLPVRLETLSSSDREALRRFCDGGGVPGGVPDRAALRFLAACKFDASKAAAMLQKDAEWRASYKPESIGQEDIRRSLPSGCWRMAGSMVRRDGDVAVLWIQCSLWRPEEYDVEEYTRMYHSRYVADDHVTVLPGIAKYCGAGIGNSDHDHDDGLAMVAVALAPLVLFDMSGWKLYHSKHVKKVHSLVSTLQEHYPERLRAALLVRTPALFEVSWKLIKPWIDPATAVKVHFLPKDPAAETKGLLAHLDASILPMVYGGQLNPEAVPCPGIPGQPEVQVIVKK
eukprot:gene2302-3150_t